MNRQLTSLFVALIVAMSLTDATHAGSIAVDFATYDTSGDSNNELGFAFDLSQTRTVDGLGMFLVYNALQDPAHKVGLWNEAGDLLASATITPTSPLVPSAMPFFPGWLIESITPIELTPGRYYIAALYQTTADAFLVGADQFILDPAVTIAGTRGFFTSGGANLVFPSVDFTDSYPLGLYGPTFTLVSAVPEPASLTLLGLTGLTLLRRRR